MHQTKKNILLLHSSSDLYGSGKILLHIIDTLNEVGHKIIVILPGQGPLIEEISKRKVQVIIINLAVLRKKYLNILGLFNRIKRFIIAYKALLKTISKENIDLIYTNTSVILVGGFVAKRKKIKHIWHIHEIPIRPKWYASFIGRYVNSHSSYVICVSQAVKAHWSKWVANNKIETVYNGITETKETIDDVGQSIRKEYSISPQDQIITMIGRIHPLKGQEYFVEIANRIIRDKPDVKFLIVGDPYPGDENLVVRLKTKIHRMDLVNHIFLTGFRTDIKAILKETDLLIHPSVLPDSFPTVILESMHEGIPVIATNLGGSTELIADEVSGVIIPYNDVKLASKKILELLSDKEKMIRYQQESKKRIDKLFNIKAFKSNLLCCLYKLS